MGHINLGLKKVVSNGKKPFVGNFTIDVEDSKPTEIVIPHNIVSIKIKPKKLRVDK